MQKENGGVLMINFWSAVIRCSDDWADAADMDDVVRHIVYVKNLIGVDHIGMGADYDGVGSVPLGLEDVATYPNLFARLLQQPGWTAEDIKKVAGLNILRVMREVERVAAEDMADFEPDDETLVYDEFLKENNATECKTIRDVVKQPKEEEDSY